MAGSTTNLGLIKPLGSEKIRIAQFNQNSDTLDAAIGPVGSTSLQTQVGAIEDGIAIVANGDSHVAITAGQFVYVRNNTHNLAEGLYVASANVSANATITSNNMTADPSGGLNALNANISNIDPKRGNIDSVANDTYLFGLNAGTYQVVVGSGSAVTNGYIPSQYGTLTVNDSGAAYKSYIFVATNGKAFYRECHKNDQTWYTEWQELALNANLDDRIPPKLKIARNPTNATSFEFNIEKSSNSFSYFLLVGGWEATSIFLYLGFISTANAVTLNKIGGSTVPGIAGTYDGSKLTITVTNTTYGGMRLIWLS